MKPFLHSSEIPLTSNRSDPGITISILLLDQLFKKGTVLSTTNAMIFSVFVTSKSTFLHLLNSVPPFPVITYLRKLLYQEQYTHSEQNRMNLIGTPKHVLPISIDMLIILPRPPLPRIKMFILRLNEVKDSESLIKRSN